MSDRPDRVKARVNTKLETNLATYVTAAVATGVGVLALAKPADAKIVYTPTNIESIPAQLDLNNDGVTDLSFVPGAYAYDSSILAYAGNNRFMSAGKALQWGARIGPKAPFSSNRALIVRIFRHFGCSGTVGSWVGKSNHYLGVQFSIAGQTHYGWVRLSLSRFCHSNNQNPAFVISGYAYETIANKPIAAGETWEPKVAGLSEPDRVPAPICQSAGLGLLALGTNGLNIWRREDDAA